MLAKKYRFKNFNFQKLINQGQKAKNRYFLIYYLKNENQKKFAVLVKKDYSKKAVIRNKIKRRIFEILRNNLNKINNGYYLIIVFKECQFLKFTELQNELLKILLSIS